MNLVSKAKIRLHVLISHTVLKFNMVKPVKDIKHWLADFYWRFTARQSLWYGPFPDWFLTQSYYVLISGLELVILLFYSHPRARVTTSGYCGFAFVCLFLEEVNKDILI